MPAKASFTDADRQRFDLLKADLRKHLPKTRPDSEALLHCAQAFVEVRDRQYNLLDEEEQCTDWMDRIMGVGPHQANKFFKVAGLVLAEVRGKSQGIEVMYQIKLARPEMRDTMWRLAEDEGLSAGALSAGRLRALPHVEKGHLQKALGVLERVARRQQKKIEQKRAERTVLARLTPFERIEKALEEQIIRVEKLNKSGLVVPAESIQRLMELIGQLAQAGAQLAEKHGVAIPTDQVSETSQTSGTSEKPETSASTSEQTGTSATSAEPAPVPPIEPVVAAMRQCLTPEEKEQVQIDLHVLIGCEAAPEKHTKLLVKLREVAPMPAGLGESLDGWLGRLHHPDREVRGRAGLDLLVAAELPGYGRMLHSLIGYPIPDEVMLAAMKLCRQIPIFSPFESQLRPQPAGRAASDVLSSSLASATKEWSTVSISLE